MAQKYVTVPKAVRDAAKKGLKLRKEWGRGGIGPGQTTARHLAKGKFPVSRIKKMYSYLSRHQVDKKSKRWKEGMPDGGPSPGKIAWYLWGGDPGFRWIKSQRKKLNPISVKRTGPGKHIMITKSQYDWAGVQRYPLAAVYMSPKEFLLLTTGSEYEEGGIYDRASTLGFYNSDEYLQQATMPPHIFINDFGQVITWEGRHRAAAFDNAGGTDFPVFIFGRESQEIPDRIVNDDREFELSFKKKIKE